MLKSGSKALCPAPDGNCNTNAIEQRITLALKVKCFNTLLNMDLALV